MAFPALLAAADRAALQHLGGPVRYAPTVGDPVDVVGVFDAGYVLAEAGPAGVSSSAPGVFLLLADLPVDPELDPDPTVTVDGVAYQVREVKKDGLGGVVLLMHEAG